MTVSRGISNNVWDIVINVDSVLGLNEYRCGIGCQDGEDKQKSRWELEMRKNNSMSVFSDPQV